MSLAFRETLVFTARKVTWQRWASLTFRVCSLRLWSFLQSRASSDQQHRLGTCKFSHPIPDLLNQTPWGGPSALCLYKPPMILRLVKSEVSHPRASVQPTLPRGQKSCSHFHTSSDDLVLSRYYYHIMYKKSYYHIMYKVKHPKKKILKDKIKMKLRIFFNVLFSHGTVSTGGNIHHE